MHYLLFIGALLFFAFMTPELAVAVGALVLFVTVVVKVSAQVVAGVSPTLGESFRSVFYASLLVALALLAFLSFTGGVGAPRRGLARGGRAGGAVRGLHAGLPAGHRHLVRRQRDGGADLDAAVGRHPLVGQEPGVRRRPFHLLSSSFPRTRP
jgi:hypothetical protein